MVPTLLHISESLTLDLGEVTTKRYFFESFFLSSILSSMYVGHLYMHRFCLLLQWDFHFLKGGIFAYHPNRYNSLYSDAVI